MKKLFNIKITELKPADLFEKLSRHAHLSLENHGLYDLTFEDNKISGFFWAREAVVVPNELDLHTLGEPLTFYKLNRFEFSLKHINKYEYLLTISSSSRSIKPLLKLLQETTDTKVFVSQIEISLTSLIHQIEKVSSAPIEITHAYASNQVLSKSEKITFSVYSTENAINAAQKTITGTTIKFDRIRLRTSHEGTILTLDIKSNCLYSISESSSEIEKILECYVLSTQEK